MAALGDERGQRLGSYYSIVQSRVNEMLSCDRGCSDSASRSAGSSE